MEFESVTDVAASPAVLWATLVDVERWPDLIESMREVRWLDESSLAVGHRARILQPGLPAATWQVTEVEPGRSFTWRTESPGTTTVGRHAVVGAGDGASRLTLGLEVTGPVGGIYARLGGGRIRRYLGMESDGLRRAAEAAGGR